MNAGAWATVGAFAILGLAASPAGLAAPPTGGGAPPTVDGDEPPCSWWLYWAGWDFVRRDIKKCERMDDSDTESIKSDAGANVDPALEGCGFKKKDPLISALKASIDGPNGDKWFWFEPRAANLQGIHKAIHAASQGIHVADRTDPHVASRGLAPWRE